MGNYKIRSLEEAIISKLKSFILQNKVEDFSRDLFNPSFPCAVLYPTDDFHLSEEQFSAIKKLLRPGEKLFVLQTNLQSELFSCTNKYYEIESPFHYETYSSIWLDSVSLLFSDSFKWVVLTNEAPEGGEGLFIGYPEDTETFLREYGHGEKDIKLFIEYYKNRRLFSPEAQTHINEMTYLNGRHHSFENTGQGTVCVNMDEKLG